MMEPIPQTGENAEALKAIAAKIKVPDGFKINLYAIVPDARHMAVGPQGVVTFVGTRKELVYSMTDRNKDRVADDVKVFAPSIKMAVPNGVCFSRDGHLYLAEQNRVLWFPAAEFFYEGPDVAAFAIVKQGELIPASDESYNHTARTCRVGPDGRIYITIGQPFNVPAPELLPEFQKLGIGGIISMKQDGTDRKIYARGMRNPLGIDFNPKDKTIWVNDNQVDGMGDTIPPGEMNRVTGRGPEFWLPLVWRRQDPNCRVQGCHSARRRDLPGGRAGRSRSRSRPVVLHRQTISREIPRRHFLDPAWILESRGPGGRPSFVHLAKGRRHSGQDGGVRRRLAEREWRVSWAAWSMFRCSTTARCWYLTIWLERSGGFPTAIERHSPCGGAAACVVIPSDKKGERCGF